MYRLITNNLLLVKKLLPTIILCYLFILSPVLYTHDYIGVSRHIVKSNIFGHSRITFWMLLTSQVYYSLV
nr:MAG TPA: hypothetical protein [Crassvirales sp.]